MLPRSRACAAGAPKRTATHNERIGQKWRMVSFFRRRSYLNCARMTRDRAATQDRVGEHSRTKLNVEVWSAAKIKKGAIHDLSAPFSSPQRSLAHARSRRAGIGTSARP